MIKNKEVFAFSSNMKEQFRVKQNEEVTIKAKDCFSNQLDDGIKMIEIDFSYINPATGPIYVEGVKKGDTLVVEILDIKLHPFGHVGVFKSFGILNDKVKEDEYEKVYIKDSKVEFFGSKFDLKPMVGVIGVATKENEIPTGSPGKHGGNMDTLDVKVGSKLEFKANHDGALFALGDVHAVMGDGEISGCALETQAEVKVKFSVKKESVSDWPVIETADELMIVCSNEDLFKACQIATDEMVNYIKRKNNISWEHAYMLASMNMDLRISQVVNPLKTVRSVIRKGILNANI